MINFYFADFAKAVFASLLALSQSSAKTATPQVSMLNLRDKIAGMTWPYDAADARPLWAFCSSEVSNNITTANCLVPQMSKLAIGHVFLATDNAFREMEWSELVWQL